MIAWEEKSAHYTIETGATWYGKKGLLYTLGEDNLTVTLEPPGDKIGAELWVAVKSTGDGSWSLLFQGSPSSALEPEPTSAWFIQGTGIVVRFVAINKDKWVIAVTNGASSL